MITREIAQAEETVFTNADFDRLQAVLESPRSGPATGAAALRKELQRGKVVSAQEVPKGVVTMNSRVRVRHLDERVSKTYSVVYPADADIGRGKISVLAPIGAALLGARIGQVVEFTAPAGRRRLRVEKVLYQPEAAGDFHR
jgi:regulator of nucleoside diphosphate kinase